MEVLLSSSSSSQRSGAPVFLPTPTSSGSHTQPGALRWCGDYCESVQLLASSAAEVLSDDALSDRNSVRTGVGQSAPPKSPQPADVLHACEIGLQLAREVARLKARLQATQRRVSASPAERKQLVANAARSHRVSVALEARCRFHEEDTRAARAQVEEVEQALEAERDNVRWYEGQVREREHDVALLRCQLDAAAVDREQAGPRHAIAAAAAAGLTAIARLRSLAAASRDALRRRAFHRLALGARRRRVYDGSRRQRRVGVTLRVLAEGRAAEVRRAVLRRLVLHAHKRSRAKAEAEAELRRLGAASADARVAAAERHAAELAAAFEVTAAAAAGVDALRLEMAELRSRTAAERARADHLHGRLLAAEAAAVAEKDLSAAALWVAKEEAATLRCAVAKLRSHAALLAASQTVAKAAADAGTQTGLQPSRAAAAQTSQPSRTAAAQTDASVTAAKAAQTDLGWLLLLRECSGRDRLHAAESDQRLQLWPHAAPREGAAAAARRLLLEEEESARQLLALQSGRGMHCSAGAASLAVVCGEAAARLRLMLLFIATSLHCSPAAAGHVLHAESAARARISDEAAGESERMRRVEEACRGAPAAAAATRQLLEAEEEGRTRVLGVAAEELSGLAAAAEETAQRVSEVRARRCQRIRHVRLGLDVSDGIRTRRANGEFTGRRYTQAGDALPACNGVVVVAVDAGGPADAAGIQAGDVITRLGGAATANLPLFRAAWRGLAPGQEVPVDVLRKTGEEFGGEYGLRKLLLRTEPSPEERGRLKSRVDYHIEIPHVGGPLLWTAQRSKMRRAVSVSPPPCR
eukprot:TRINITY_DN13147_c0_g1_i1.p1 TRINITY_DN13147_c0_g1~~TRINITY_DN13147_c0_g1_i1.p1  ORF type:complete len:812 (+),score=275.46 TRINITY_DN13147_c0_g1_i1:68-2503(+)